MFITSPKIREALKQTNMKEGSAFGLVNYAYYPKRKLLVGLDFFPLPIDRESVNRGSPVQRKEFAKLGIPSIIESKILANLAELYPNARQISFYKKNELTKQRMKKMGLAVKKNIKLANYKKALREKLARDITKARRKTVAKRN